MPNLASQFEIALTELFPLLCLASAAAHSKQIGELGVKSFNEKLIEISRRSKVCVTASELEDLVYHAKQAIFEKIKPVYTDLRESSYHSLMTKLQDQCPLLFKELKHGEITFVRFED